MGSIKDRLKELQSLNNQNPNHQEQTSPDTYLGDISAVSGNDTEMQANTNEQQVQEQNPLAYEGENIQQNVADNTFSVKYTDANFGETTMRSIMRGLGKSVIAGTGDVIQLANDYLIGDLKNGNGNMLSRALQSYGNEMALKQGTVYIPEELQQENITWASMADPKFWSIHVAEFIPQLAEFILLSHGGGNVAKGLTRSIAGAMGESADVMLNTAKTAMKGVKVGEKVAGSGRGLAGKLLQKTIEGGVELTKGADFVAGSVGAGFTSNLFAGAQNVAQAIQERRNMKNDDGTDTWNEEQLSQWAADSMKLNLAWMPLEMASWGITYAGGMKGITGKLGNVIKGGEIVSEELTRKAVGKTFGGIMKNVFKRAGKAVPGMAFEGVEEQFQEVFENWAVERAAAEAQGAEGLSKKGYFDNYMKYYMQDDQRATKVISFAAGMAGGAVGHLMSDVNEKAELAYKIYDRAENLKTVFADNHSGKEMQEYNKQTLLADLAFSKNDDKAFTIDNDGNVIPGIYIQDMIDKGVIETQEEVDELYENFKEYQDAAKSADILNVKGRHAYMSNIAKKVALEKAYRTADENHKLELDEVEKIDTDNLEQLKIKESKKKEIDKKYDLIKNGILEDIAAAKVNITNLSLGKQIEKDITSPKQFYVKSPLNKNSATRTTYVAEGMTKDQFMKWVETTDEEIYEQGAKKEKEKTLFGKIKKAYDKLKNGIYNKDEDKKEEGKDDTKTSNEDSATSKKHFAQSLSNDVIDLSDTIDNGMSYKSGNTNVVLQDDGGDTINIESIETPENERGKGSAKKAMNDIIAKADEQGKKLSLRVAPKDKSTDAKKLTDWYKSLGFKEDGDKMVREPIKEKKEPETKENKDNNTSESETETKENKSDDEVINKVLENKNIVNDSEEPVPYHKKDDANDLFMKGKKDGGPQVHLSTLLEIARKESAGLKLTPMEENIALVFNKEVLSLQDKFDSDLEDSILESLKNNKGKSVNNFQGMMAKKRGNYKTRKDKKNDFLLLHNLQSSNERLQQSYSDYIKSTEMVMTDLPLAVQQANVVNRSLNRMFPDKHIQTYVFDDLYNAIGVKAIGYSLGNTIFIDEKKWNQDDIYMHEMLHVFYNLKKDESVAKAIIDNIINNNPKLYESIKNKYYEYVRYSHNGIVIENADELVKDRLVIDNVELISQADYENIVKELIDSGELKELPKEEQYYIQEEVFTHAMQGPMSEHFDKYFTEKEPLRQNLAKRFWKSLKGDAKRNDDYDINELVKSLNDGKSVNKEELQAFFFNGFIDSIAGSKNKNFNIGMKAKEERYVDAERHKEIYDKLIEQSKYFKSEDEFIKLMKSNHLDTEEVMDEIYTDLEEMDDTQLLEIIDSTYKRKEKKATAHVAEFLKHYNRSIKKYNVGKDVKKRLPILRSRKLFNMLFVVARNSNTSMDFIAKLEDTQYTEIKEYLKYLNKISEGKKEALLHSLWVMYSNQSELKGKFVRTDDFSFKIEDAFSHNETKSTQNTAHNLNELLIQYHKDKSLADSVPEIFGKIKRMEDAIERIEKNERQDGDEENIMNALFDYWNINGSAIKENGYLIWKGYKVPYERVINGFIRSGKHRNEKGYISAYSMLSLMKSIYNTNREHTKSAMVQNVKGNNVPAKQIKNMLSRELENMENFLKQKRKPSKERFINEFTNILKTEKGVVNKYLQFIYDNYMKTGKVPVISFDTGIDSKYQKKEYKESNALEQKILSLGNFLNSEYKDGTYDSQITVFGPAPRSLSIQMPLYGKDYINEKGEFVNTKDKRNQVNALLKSAYAIYEKSTDEPVSFDDFKKQILNIKSTEKLLKRNKHKFDKRDGFKILYNQDGSIKTHILKQWNLSNVVNGYMLQDMLFPSIKTADLLKRSKQAISPVFANNPDLKFEAIFYKDPLTSFEHNPNFEETDGSNFIIPESLELIRNSVGGFMPINEAIKLLNNSIERNNPNFKGETIGIKGYTTVLSEDYVKQHPEYAGARKLLLERHKKYVDYHHKKYGVKPGKISVAGFENNIPILVPTSTNKHKNYKSISGGVDFNEMTLDSFNNDTSNANKYFDALYYDKEGNHLGLEAYNFGPQQVFDKPIADNSKDQKIKTAVQLINSIIINAKKLGHLDKAEAIQLKINEALNKKLEKILKKIDTGDFENYNKLILDSLNMEDMDQLQRYALMHGNILSPGLNEIAVNQLTNSIKKAGNMLFTHGSYSIVKPGYGYKHKHIFGNVNRKLQGYINNETHTTAAEAILPKKLESHGVRKREVYTLENKVITNASLIDQKLTKKDALKELRKFAENRVIEVNPGIKRSDVDKEIITVFNEDKNSSKYKYMEPIGFAVRGEKVLMTRVPSHGPSSTGVFEVVDFLKSDDNAVEVPSQFQYIVGGDNDGDALFIQTKHSTEKEANEVVQMIQDLWLSKEMQETIQAPIVFEDEVKEIIKKRDKYFVSNNDITIPHHPDSRADNFSNSVTSAKNIGIVFNLHKAMNILSAYGTDLRNPITIDNKRYTRFEDFGFGIKSRSLKSAIVANIILDNAKHQTALKLGINEHTVSMAVQLVNLGIPLENVSYILNNDIVRKYVDRKNENDTVFLDNESDYTILKDLKHKKGNDIVIESSKNIISNPADSNFNSKENQNAILDLIAQSNTINSQISGMQNILSGTKKIDSNPFVLAEHIRKYEQFINNKFYDYKNKQNNELLISDEVKNNPDLQRLYKNAKIVLQHTKKLSNVHNVNTEEIFDNLINKLNLRGVSDQKIRKYSKMLETFLNARLLGLNNKTKEQFEQLVNDSNKNNIFKLYGKYISDLIEKGEFSKNLLVTEGITADYRGNDKYIGLNREFTGENYTRQEHIQMLKEFDAMPDDLQRSLVAYDLLTRGWGTGSMSPIFGEKLTKNMAFIRENNFYEQDNKIDDDILQEIEETIAYIDSQDVRNSIYKIWGKGNLIDVMQRNNKLRSLMNKNEEFYFMYNKKLYKFDGATDKEMQHYNQERPGSKNKLKIQKYLWEKHTREIVKDISKVNPNINLITIEDRTTGIAFLPELTKLENSNKGMKMKGDENYFEYNSSKVMTEEEYATAEKWDNNVNKLQRETLYDLYKKAKDKANKLYDSGEVDNLESKSTDKLFKMFQDYGKENAYAYAILTEPILRELTKRLTSYQSNLTKRSFKDKDITPIEMWMNANDVPSNHPAVQGLIRTIDVEYKKYAKQKQKYSKKINKATESLYQSKFGFNPTKVGTPLNVAKKFYYQFLGNRKSMYEILYGNLVEKVYHEKEGNKEMVPELKLKPKEVIQDMFDKGQISKEEYNFYQVFRDISNELRPFALGDGNDGRRDYIPHTSMGTFEMLYNRGLLGLMANAKTNEEHLLDVKIYWRNPDTNNRELVRFSDFKNYYFGLAKHSGKDISKIRDYMVGYRKAKSSLKKGTNEDGSPLEYTDMENSTAIGLGNLINRFSNRRSDKSSIMPSMDLNKAISDYTHSTLFVNGNAKFKGFKNFLPIIDGILAETKRNNLPNMNKFVKVKFKDYFMRGKRQESFLGKTGDKIVEKGVYANLLYIMGYKALVATGGTYVIGNILAGKYHQLKNSGSGEWARGEMLFWGLDKGLSNPFDIRKRMRRSSNILKNIQYMNANIHDDIGVQKGGQLDSFFLDIALLPMTWSEKWIQEVQALGQLTDEELNKFDDEGNYKPGVVPISEERITQIEEEVKRSQGKGYQPTDQRVIQMYSLGQAMMQFNRWIPTLIHDRWAKEDIDRFGNKHIGSLRAVGKGVGQALTEMDPKAFLRYRNSLSPAMKKRFDSGLKGIGYSMFLLMVGYGLDNDTSKELYSDTNIYADADRMLYKGMPSALRSASNIMM